MSKLNKSHKPQMKQPRELSRLMKKYSPFIIGGIVLFFGLGLLLGFLIVTSTEKDREALPTPPQPEARVSPTAIIDTPTAEATEAPLQPTPSPTHRPTKTPRPSPTPQPPFFEGPIEYGHSFNQRPLYAYRLGNGPSARAIIGGIHGGYEWNTVHLVSDTLKYFREHPSEIPDNVTLYIIPNMNPDGYAAGTDPVVARMNGRGVDLNRNWNYQWQMTATHGTRPVKAGDYAFSEPETAFTRDFILEHDIELAIFYHSAMGVVFSGAERDKAPTYELTEMLSDVTGYRHQTQGVPGQITTGDAIDYLSDIGIPATEIELTTHDLIGPAEWQRNLEGIKAFLNWQIPNRTVIPPTLDAEQVGNGTFTYTVKPNDTLSGIALEFGVDVPTLQYINGLTDADYIQDGQELQIPITYDED